MKDKVREQFFLTEDFSVFSLIRDCKSFLIKSLTHTFNSWCTQDFGPTAPIYMLICYRELQSFSIPKAQEIVRFMLCCNYWYLRQPVHGQGAKCSGSPRQHMGPGGNGIGECHWLPSMIETICSFVSKCGPGIAAPKPSGVYANQEDLYLPFCVNSHDGAGLPGRAVLQNSSQACWWEFRRGQIRNLHSQRHQIILLYSEVENL